MANRAYLVGSENADTAGPNEEGINYDPDTEILAGASYHLPVFWFSIFDESHLKTHAIQEHKIETFVADVDTAKRLLQQRRATVLATFPQCESHWNAWTQLITEAPFKFFKIDATEIWELNPDQLKQRLPGAVRWFCGGCGTKLTYEGARWPGEVHVLVGTMDDPAAVTPAAHVYVAHQMPWLHLADGLPRFSTVPSEGALPE